MENRVEPWRVRDAAARAYAAGQFARALKLYTALEKSEPSEPEWPRRTAEVHRRLGNTKEQIDALVRAAEIYSEQGALLKAIAACKRILEIDPKHVYTQRRLAELHSAPAARLSVPPPPAQAAQRPSRAPSRPSQAPSRPSQHPPHNARAARLAEIEADEPEWKGRPIALNELPLGKIAVAKVERPLGANRASLPPEATEIARYEIAVPPTANDSDPIELEIERNETPPGELPADGLLELPPTVDGDASVKARTVLPKTPLFSFLGAQSLEHLISRVVLVPLEKGQVLFRQGDRGDTLYVVAEGEVAVFAEGPERVELAKFGEGAFFGEIGLLADQHRTATAEAAADSQLLAIDRSVITELLANERTVLGVLLHFFRARLVERLVRTSRLFAPFSGPERWALASRFRFFHLPDGVPLIVEGQRSPALYTVLAGKADVIRSNVPGGPRVVATLGPGDICGELSLLTLEPAIATVKTNGVCCALALPSEDFQRLIITHPSVLAFIDDLARERRERAQAIAAGRIDYEESRVELV